MKTCAVCGREISKYDLCGFCYKKWGSEGEYPAWLKELVKIEQHNYDRAKRGKLEICYTDLPINEKVHI